MKTVHLSPIDRKVNIATNERILDALLAEEVDVMMACGGRGICATCHVYVEEGQDALTPKTDREKRTLGRVSGRGPNSRLACQARVLRPGVEVRLPDGTYVTNPEDVRSLIGKRAEQTIRHPIDGRLLVEEGKLITRTLILQLSDVDFDIDEVRATDV
jgi:ferredoxin